MTNQMYVWNQMPPTLSLQFSQLGAPLEQGKYWDVLSESAPYEDSGNPTDVMWVDNSEGIKDNLEYWWDIDVSLPDGTYLFTAQPREIGDAVGSDKSISTKRTQPDEWNDPWITTEENWGPNHIVSVDGQSYEIQYVWDSMGTIQDWCFSFWVSPPSTDEERQRRREEMLAKTRALRSLS
ncbi:hypothetical protein [Parafrankia elaeagni]|uniref:hypothetical protein n=1 Tax=Parafrankia elaeagni TaxID=222534 RepID=UPI0003685ACB|nr:hypothetical protein [Parafrankia elaeagni]